MSTIQISPHELQRGSEAFRAHEPRDSMYRVALFLLDHWWGDHTRMVDALTVLLLTWNGAFYRYGPFDQDALERCLKHHWDTIENFHQREIASLRESDRDPLKALFLSLLDALRIAQGKKAGARSPVSVAKTLHLLAPDFLPIWDDRIARAYKCAYSLDPSDSYLRFCNQIRDIAADLRPHVPGSHSTLLKRIDEYNYAKFTKNWI